MKEPIKILLLEDLESDAELAEHEVKKSISDYQIQWVDNREDFIQQLKTYNPDIVISDYRLPTFDGLSALKLKQSIKPEIPFIVFTGSINEDTAVECMKAGATDYIIKEHLKRLGPAITNALEQKGIVDAKHKTEKELLESEKRFHRMADNMPDMIYRIAFKPHKRFEYVNPATEKVTGHPAKEFYEDPELGAKITHPDDLEYIQNKVLKTEFYKPTTTRLIKKDGSVIWIEQRNIPIYNNNGEIVAIEGIAQDITEKRNAQIQKQAIYDIAMASNNARNLNELFVEMHKIISGIMPANNFYIALYNEKSNEINFPYFVDEKSEQPTTRKFGNGYTEYVIRTGKPLLCDTECAVILKGKGEIEQIGAPHTIWLGVPLKFEGKTIGVMALQHYYNESVYGEKEKSMLEYVSLQIAKAIVYKQSEEQVLKLSKAVEQSPVSIIITDTQGTIEYVNPTFSEFTGYQAEEVIGEKSSILKSGDTPNETYVNLWKTVKLGHTWTGELMNKKKNGELFIESANITPITDEQGNIINFLGIKEDITKKKQNERELIEAKEKAQESDRLKTAFLQNMSHEIRTPMNAIVGFSELMELEIEDPNKLKYYIEVIKQRSNDLLDIINELLDIARIEAGQLSIKAEEVDINKLLLEVSSFYSGHKLKIEKSTVELFVKNIPVDYSSITTTDPGKLKQILFNLIHNALKFTNEGRIEFGFHSIENNHITFFVSDTGIGIPDDMKNIIFERFRKSSNESDYVQDGIGLGLAIVKGLLNLFEGKIWVESEVNKGSTFYFTIPYKPVIKNSTTNTPLKQDKYNWINRNLLIVEDDPFNAAYFTEILNSTGISYNIASNGKQAIDLFSNNGPIDLVLMDIKLPDMSGYEVIKEFIAINSKVPIIAQTAYASDLDKQKALDAGCVNFISKPIKREFFMEIIDSYVK
ncbi:MAG: response regulator [Bacteroidales bacterium]|nr:response regulator [Bacteroidales bacterium]HPD95939.1 response regulator [Tenuifilaceae bacterium]